MTYQFVRLDIHQRKIAEKLIQTFKDHFVALFSEIDESFPMDMWDRLLPQAEMALSLLRQSKVASKVSAWAYLLNHMITMQCHWHCWVVKFKYMKNWGA